MERIIHKIGALVIGLVLVSPVLADEAGVANNANYTIICQCLKEGKDRNCAPVNATNNESPNRTDTPPHR